MKLVIASQYGRLSRGRHSARKVVGKTTTWAEKDELGRLVIDQAGKWLLHSADGYQRTARATLTVAADGSYTISGDANRFEIS